jgi:sialidase-1
MQGGTHAGRVVMPFNQGPPNDWRVYAAYSDDGGETWRMGDTAPEDGAGHANEVQMAERSDGSLLLVARQFGGGARRKRAVSTDGGVTWTRLAAVPDLPNPSCMGGLVNAQDSPGALLVCTGPSSERKRIAGWAWFSMDGGENWPRSVAVYGAGFAYSVPVRLGNGRVGVVFERDNYSRISFVELCDVPAVRAAVAHDVP